jgi:adenylate cyclase
MAGEGTERRKLAAIMFTDIVGYTAMTQRNEALTLEVLEEHRRLLRELFPKFGGQEIETTGDGFLVEFESAVEAVRCAIEIHRSLATRNMSVSPERRVELRIGVHVGDVVHKEGHILGDGVNIAARIQPLAEAGGICVSVDVARQIQHHVEARCESLGPKALKNVASPIEVCRIVLPWEKPSPALAQPVMTPRSSWRVTPAQLGAMALIIIVLGGVGWWLHYLSGRSPKLVSTAQNQLPATNPAPSVPQAVEPKSVAVLPFVNISADKADEYLSDGITEDLCTALTQVRGLRVPARTSCFVFKGKTDDIQKIGQQLRVATVLEGSVSKAGNKLRISAQLINIADGFHLWATNYDREMSDLLALRSEIAQQVVAALRVQLLPGENQRLSKKETDNPEAHRLYLIGRSFWNQRTADGLKKATNYLAQALAQDPNYALAYAALADCYGVLPEYAGVRTGEMMPKARAAALKALELDNTLGEAHAALGLIKALEFDWTGAEADYRRAIELAPNYASAHHWYEVLLRSLGRLDEASREIHRAQDLDPLSPVINANVGWVLYFQGQYAQAIAAFRAVLELNPGFRHAHLGVGAGLLAQQAYKDAITELQQFRAEAGNTPEALGLLGCAYALSGRTNEVRQVLEQLRGFIEQGYASHGELSAVYEGLGDHEKALVCLEKAAEAKEPRMCDLRGSPVYQDLRSEPRFIALLKKMGLER